jgi:IS30 family transposase
MRGSLSGTQGDAIIDTPKTLTDDELIAIHALSQRGLDPVRIARVIKRSRATVYRKLDELARLEAELPAAPCCGYRR